MKIVLSDTNIFIDLIEINLLDSLFNLPLEIKTTDFVLFELNETQQQILNIAAKQKKLKILTSDSNQIKSINDIFESVNGISFQDSGVFYFAEKENAVLLSGDGNLRKIASKRGIEVHGILWVFDLIESHKLLPGRELIEKMKSLMEINQRLPNSECISRIEKWEKQKTAFSK